MDLSQIKPPLVTFEVRDIQDQDASRRAGHPKFTSVDFAIITPRGSRDRLERKVEEWFKQLEAQVINGRWPEEWLTRLREQYKAWKAGQELPEDGTPIRTWPAATATEIKNILAANLRTVEDLAACNEEAIRLMGMGGRMLKSRAASYLEAANNVSKIAMQNEHLTQQLADLQETVKKQSEMLEKYQIEADKKVPAKA